MAAGYLARLAFFSPDVTWNRSKNPEPWERYRNKQYKVKYKQNPPMHRHRFTLTAICDFNRIFLF